MAIQEVLVEYQKEELDARGQSISVEMERDFGFIGQVTTADIYFLQGISEREAMQMARELLCNPVTQKTRLNPDIPQDPHIVRIGYKPGVMNPAVPQVLEAAVDLSLHPEYVDTAIEYRFPEDIPPGVLQEMIWRLYNPVVQRQVKQRPSTLDVDAFDFDAHEHHELSRYSDGQLQSFASDFGFGDWRHLKVIQTYFTELGRDPTMAEIYAIAGWWSEHCGHGTFRSELEIDGERVKPLYTRIKETAQLYFGEDVLSAFMDNSGVIRFYVGQAINIKGETHNYPSGISPFGGAGTGVGGDIRDVYDTGEGGIVFFSGDILCFAPPHSPGQPYPGCLPPEYIQRGVIDGIADYGNKFGVPTANGSIHYHPDFGPKPTVMVVAAGVMPETGAKKGVPQLNDLVVLIGGKTGKDGIGGATGSSLIIDENTAAIRYQSVQIGNPSEEKKVSDATKELIARKLVRARNDCGAAGISSGAGELGKNIGVTIDLAKVPRKYAGMKDWEVLISESQERSVIVVDPVKIKEFMEVCRRYGVEASVVGHFDGSRHFNVVNGDRMVAHLDYQFLEEGQPKKVLKAHWEKPVFNERVPETPRTPEEWLDTLKRMLAHGNVCSKLPVVRRYDHGVQGTSVLSSYSGKNYDGPNDAAVLTPILDQSYGAVIAHGLNPILNRINPYWGTIWAAAESVSNYVAVGGDPKTMVFNENFVSPYPTEQYLGSLDLQVRAIVDFMHTVRRPVISGKDSLSSTYRNSSTGQVVEVPPVVCLTTMGKIPDVEKTVTADIKESGSTLCLVGKLDRNLGGSVFYDINGLVGNDVPRVDLQVFPAVIGSVHQGIIKGDIKACHDVSEGGVIGAVAEMCFGGDCGVKLELDLNGQKPEEVLCNETAGCFIVEVKDEETASRLFGNVPYRVIGKSQENKQLEVTTGGNTLFTTSINELKESWEATLATV